MIPIDYLVTENFFTTSQLNVINAMKLVKQGYSINKACSEIGISRSLYYKYSKNVIESVEMGNRKEKKKEEFYNFIVRGKVEVYIKKLSSKYVFLNSETIIVFDAPLASVKKAIDLNLKIERI